MRMTTSSNLPTWDEMSDLDKGCAAMHLWKRERDGAVYAVEHYPARYLDDERLKALDPQAASRHAASMRARASALDAAEWGRLYDLALERDA
jgi:hypothetical protein